MTLTALIKNLNQKKHLNDKISETDGSVIWETNDTGFYYIKMDKNHRPSCLCFHFLGTHQDQDIEIYNEKDSGYNIHCVYSSILWRKQCCI